MKKNNWIITGVIVVVVGIAAFLGGIEYQKMQRGSFAAQFGGGQFGQGRQGRFGGANGVRPVVGEIMSADDKSITVKMQDGSTKIVIVSANTSINKAAQGSKSDLKSGQRVAVFGQANSDGSLTAQSIQLNPQMRGLGRPSGIPTQ